MGRGKIIKQLITGAIIEYPLFYCHSPALWDPETIRSILLTGYSPVKHFLESLLLNTSFSLYRLFPTSNYLTMSAIYGATISIFNGTGSKTDIESHPLT